MRKRHGGSAADAVYAHIMASCPAAAAALGAASLDGEWLAAGPIRPGMRDVYADDIFRVGNLAGESHPIIAEGISMALQSGWMLARELGTISEVGTSASALPRVNAIRPRGKNSSLPESAWLRCWRAWRFFLPRRMP